MSTPTAAAPLVAVWSRDVDATRLAGRPRMILAIRRVMAESATPLHHLRIANLLERRNLRALVDAAAAAVGDLLRGRLPSLQCLLYADAAGHQAILQHIQQLQPLTLYCDGVRCYYLLRRLMRRSPQSMRIVVDLDDLMSRRMELLGQSGLGLSLGYLHGKAPAWAIRLLTGRWFARLVAGWESAALRRVEDDLGRWAQAVVLISPVEAGDLAARYAALGAQARVVCIPPPIEVAAPPQLYPRFQRFIFIGTDTLPQNHAAIATLIALWQRLTPAAPLSIFGSMSHAWPTVAGVTFHGYAPSLADVYTEGSVLLAPGSLRGGVKTKVLEAFAHGCAVAGNSITFEGLALPDYPLLLDAGQQVERLILSPESHLEQFRAAAAAGQQYVARSFTWSSFSSAWRTTLGIAPPQE